LLANGHRFSLQEAFHMSSSPRRFSLDSWAVAVALVAALLVRAGVIKTIPW
jgi:hypothetical protein